MGLAWETQSLTKEQTNKQKKIVEQETDFEISRWNQMALQLVQQARRLAQLLVPLCFSFYKIPTGGTCRSICSHHPPNPRYIQVASGRWWWWWWLWWSGGDANFSRVWLKFVSHIIYILPSFLQTLWNATGSSCWTFANLWPVSNDLLPPQKHIPGGPAQTRLPPVARNI